MTALFRQPMDFTALKDETRLSEPTLSKHLKDLINSKFIEVKFEGRRRIYNITEKGLNSELRMYLAGIDSALKVFENNKNFWKVAGTEAVKMVSAGSESLTTFIQALARHSPIQYADDRKAKDIFDSIISKMVSNASSIEKLRENIEEVELRGGDADLFRERLREKLDKYTAIYFALGPPFSYMWKNMVGEFE
jgi:DNA-binding transcriptional regulator GbsR (MarR family)